jgi:hypothetical protein
VDAPAAYAAARSRRQLAIVGPSRLPPPELLVGDVHADGAVGSGGDGLLSVLAPAQQEVPGDDHQETRGPDGGNHHTTHRHNDTFRRLAFRGWSPVHSYANGE